MIKNIAKQYKEVRIDRNGRGEDRTYRNPLTGIFQYEYALYLAVADLFESVRCKSMCLESLKLYFCELGHKKGSAENDGNSGGSDDEMKSKKTQEDLLNEMKRLVDRDVTGNVSFPMMHICSAEVRTRAEEDGSHSFIFTDGIYGFMLHLDIQRNGRPKKIEVTDLNPKEQTTTEVIKCKEHWIETEPAFRLKRSVKKGA